MAPNRIITAARVGSRLTLLAAVLASGGVACSGSGYARAHVESPPPPGLVVVEPDVWVVGDADAPDAYYSHGYYWVVEQDHWYRRARPSEPWVIVETRVVPQRVVVHERERRVAATRHPATAPGYARRAAEQDAIEARNRAREQRAEAERRAREERAQTEADERARSQREAEEREQRAARDAAIAQQRERDDRAEQRERNEQHAQAAQQREHESAAAQRDRLAAERQAEQQRRQREAQRRHEGKDNSPKP